MTFDDLNEGGIRAALIEIRAIEQSLVARIQDAEHKVGIYETEATGLRKITAWTDQIKMHLNGKLEQIERKAKSNDT